MDITPIVTDSFPILDPKDALGTQTTLASLGVVYTFYSYKGGVGRSMALANVAVWLAQQGKKVLMLDWDLEAPGLERFFTKPSLTLSGSREGTLGIVDLIISHRERRELPWQDCVITIRPSSSATTWQGSLQLITAGGLTSRDENDYVSRLRSLNWDESFELRLGNRIEEWRSEWIKEFDFVLVDSRTGISDMGSICTVLLPDILVLVFTTSDQGVDGIADWMRRSSIAQSKLPISRGKLVALPLLTRDERDKESAQAERWRETIADKLGEFYRAWLPEGVTARDVLQKLYVPAIAQWSFGEPLPILDKPEEAKDPRSIVPAYTRLARLIETQLDWKVLDPDQELQQTKQLATEAQEAKQRAEKQEIDLRIELEQLLRRTEEERVARARAEEAERLAKARAEEAERLAKARAEEAAERRARLEQEASLIRQQLEERLADQRTMNEHLRLNAEVLKALASAEKEPAPDQTAPGSLIAVFHTWRIFAQFIVAALLMTMGIFLYRSTSSQHEAKAQALAVAESNKRIADLEAMLNEVTKSQQKAAAQESPLSSTRPEPPPTSLGPVCSSSTTDLSKASYAVIVANDVNLKPKDPFSPAGAQYEAQLLEQNGCTGTVLHKSGYYVTVVLFSEKGDASKALLAFRGWSGGRWKGAYVHQMSTWCPDETKEDDLALKNTTIPVLACTASAP